MSNIFLILLFICASAGIISELLTIALPEKILGITDKNPEELLSKRFYKVLFVLSGLYLLVVVLLLLSGIERFRLYAIIILCMSLLGWFFKANLKKHIYILVAESTISLILLLDVVRRIYKEIAALIQ